MAMGYFYDNAFINIVPTMYATNHSNPFSTIVCLTDDTDSFMCALFKWAAPTRLCVMSILTNPFYSSKTRRELALVVLLKELNGTIIVCS